jgi:hypothetical protein
LLHGDALLLQREGERHCQPSTEYVVVSDAGMLVNEKLVEPLQISFCELLEINLEADLTPASSTSDGEKECQGIVGVRRDFPIKVNLDPIASRTIWSQTPFRNRFTISAAHCYLLSFWLIVSYRPPHPQVLCLGAGAI